MVAIAPTDPTYRACFGIDAEGPDLYAMTDAEYEAYVNAPKNVNAWWDTTAALQEAYDIDRGRDICDAFERDVAELAYLDLRMHGNDISVRNAPTEFDRFAIDAAERLTETIDADLPW